MYLFIEGQSCPLVIARLHFAELLGGEIREDVQSELVVDDGVETPLS
jgi:hypothetical protein